MCVWFEVDGGEGSGWDIFNEICLVKFLWGERKGREWSKIPLLHPSESERFGGEGREDKFWYLINYCIY